MAALGRALRGASVSAILLAAWPSAAQAATAPQAVSPGEADRAAPCRDGCPDFSWAAVDDAAAYEIVIVRAEHGSADAPLLRRSFAAALLWTPALDECLEAGIYAWAVRARIGEGWTPWSEPLRFAIASRISSAPEAVPEPGGKDAGDPPNAPAPFRRISNGSPTPTAAIGESFPPGPCVAGEEVFADVSASSPFCAAIQQVYAEQLTTGCTAGPLRFCPDGPVLRRQLAVALARTRHARDARQVAAGGLHSCGLRGTGLVTCWGTNGDGQVSPVPARSFTQIAAGSNHSCGLEGDGGVVCWGDDTYGQSTAPAGPFSQVTAGGAFTCALAPAGGIVCWGLNSGNQISPLPPGAFTQIDSGDDHSCAVRTDGQAICWGGGNQYGELLPPPGTYAQVAAGRYHSCGLQTNGGIVCWGDNYSGQTSPVPAGTYAQVEAGADFSCGLLTDGKLQCWGSDAHGAAGPPPGTFRQVSLGASHGCALSASDAVLCWGSEFAGDTQVPPGFP